MIRILLLVLIVTSPVIVTAQSKTKGILLEDLTWLEAEKVLTKDTVVVIPLATVRISALRLAVEVEKAR